MFVPFWLFIVLSGFGCYGALVFINAIRNRKSKVVSPSASHNKQSTPLDKPTHFYCQNCGGKFTGVHFCNNRR